MSVRRLLQKAVPAVALCASFAFPAHAGSLRTIDCNPDMYNLTGRPANDFDILLGNFQPANLLEVYTDPLRVRNPFPDYSVTDLGGGDVLVRYFGAVVPDRAAVHVGIRVAAGVGNGVVKDQYWTWDGANIGAPAFRCNLLPQDYNDGSVTNTSTIDAYWVQRRVLYQMSQTALSDLLPGTTLWNSAALIDSAPVLVGAGQSLAYGFGVSGDGSYILGYDVWTDNNGQVGELAQRVMQAYHVVPEPGTLLLVGAALVAAFGRRSMRLGRR
ncbi:MAG: PEP-CTERM sorting domain-containing protein [Burkholderiales bacterium]|nr:PEP-CTERM sorting domain-containing protein [Burkholderiales bacterium]